jgi:hypothetical protein
LWQIKARNTHLMSNTTSVGSLTSMLIAPLLPAGKIAAFRNAASNLSRHHAAITPTIEAPL